MSTRCFNTNNSLLILLCIVLIVFSTEAQHNRVFSNRVTVNENVTNPRFAVDPELSNFASLISTSGAIVGIGGTSGVFELAFEQPMEANQTTYLRLDFEDDIFNAFLGGDFGVLLSNLLGTTIFGNHILEIEARNGSETVLRGETSEASDFTGERLRVVVDELGDFYLRITPDDSYDRIWIKDRTTALVGLGIENETQVYYAFSFTDDLTCVGSEFTGFDVSGLNLGAFDDEPPVIDLPLAIDRDPDSYAKLSLGNLSASGYIRQDIYFNAHTFDQDLLSARIRLDPDLISAELLNSISILALDGSEEVFRRSLADLLTEEMLDALGVGMAIDIPFTPYVPVNRVALQFDAGIQISNDAVLEFSGVSISPSPPSLVIPDGEYYEICAGDEVELKVEVDEAYLIRWYDEPEGGIVLATTSSGELFNPGTLGSDRAFYATAYNESCDKESSRIAMEVMVNPTPTVEDLEITGNLGRYCEGDVLEFLPQLSEESSLSQSEVEFTWYATNDKLTPILDGDDFSAGTVSISENGAISITGLAANDYSLFLVVKNADGCENPDGQLLMVAFQILASPTEADIQVFNGNICEGESFTLSATAAQVENPVYRFYLDQELTNELIDLTVSPTQTTTYYVTVEGDGTCGSRESDPEELVVTVNSGSMPEIIVTDGSICEGESFTLSATAAQVENPVYRFYLDQELTNELTDLTVSPSQTTFFYVTVEGGGICTTRSNPEVLTVTVTSTDAPLVNNPTQELCDRDKPTLASIAIEGASIWWYESASSQTPLLTSTPMEDGQTYYASQTINGCESQERAAVTITLINCEEELRDLEIKKTASVSNVLPGGEITYTILLSNPNTSEVTNVTVSDELDDFLIYVNAGNGGSLDNRTVTWTVPSIPAESQLTLVLNVLVNNDTPAGTKLSNSAIVIPSDQRFKIVESDPAIVTVVEDLDDSSLKVVKTANKTTAQVGDQIAYSIQVMNTSASVIEMLIIKDLLAEELEFVGASQNGEFQSGTVTWELENLAAGQISELLMNVTIGESAVQGQQISNLAFATFPDGKQIESEPVDVLITSGGDQETTLVSLIKTQDKNTAIPGELVTYTLTISNEGAVPAENLVLRDFLPQGILVIQLTGSGVQDEDEILWEIPSLAAGTQISFEVQVIIIAEDGRIVNKAEVSGDNFPEERDQTDPLLIGGNALSDLSIQKEVSKSVIAVGEEFEYRLTVANKLESAANELVITDTLPVGVEYVSSSAMAGISSYSIGDKTLSWTIASLDPLSLQSLTIKVRALKEGEISNTATVMNLSKDLDYSDNSSSVTHQQLDFLIPNVFSPNGDGINDTWEILGLSDFFTNHQLVIVNRYAVEVFKSTDYQNDWDADNLAGGTYFYTLTGTDNTGAVRSITGFLTIIK